MDDQLRHRISMMVENIEKKQYLNALSWVADINDRLLGLLSQELKLDGQAHETGPDMVLKSRVDAVRVSEEEYGGENPDLGRRGREER